MPEIMFFPSLTIHNSPGPLPIAIQDHDRWGLFFVPLLVLGRKREALLY